MDPTYGAASWPRSLPTPTSAEPTELWQLDVTLAESNTRTTRYTSLVTIEHLPPEILCAIFEWIAEAEPNRRDRYPSKIVVTHVCAQWRHIALTCANLWSRISVTASHSRSWLTEIITRSRPAPLNIAADVYNDKTLDLTIIVLKEISRIQSLNISISIESEVYFDSVLPFLQSSAPVLKYFSVHCYTQAPPEFAPVNTLPSTLFGGNSPCLRSLSIEGCSMSWESPLLSHLTTLKIYDLPPSALRSLSQILATLAAMPDLCVLELSGVFRYDSDSASTYFHETVELPSLKLLSLTMEYSRCTSLLSHLKYPSTTSHDISTYPSLAVGPFSNNIAPLSQIGRILSQRVGPIRCLEIKTLHWSPMIRLKAWTDSANGLSMPTGPAPFILDLDLPDYEEALPKYYHQEQLDVIWTALPKTCLESLHVKHILFEPHMWRTAFGDLPNLKNISFSGNPASLLSALQVDGSDVPVHDSDIVSPVHQMDAKLWFPALRSVSANFFDGSIHESDLIRCLVERQRREVALNELCLGRLEPNLDSPQCLERLRGLVKHVYWDRQD